MFKFRKLIKEIPGDMNDLTESENHMNIMITKYNQLDYSIDKINRIWGCTGMYEFTRTEINMEKFLTCTTIWRDQEEQDQESSCVIKIGETLERKFLRLLGFVV